MANLTETPTWVNGIYQLETSDPVLGGPDGIDNLQARQLANRTGFLKKQIDDLVSGALSTMSAHQLSTPREITLTGDAEGSINFDGSDDASMTVTVAGLKTATPPGMTGFFASSTPPNGWLKANGAAISRTTYAALFAVVGTTFGIGDGSSTFNLPDLRGEFVRGWDDGRGVENTRLLGSSQAATSIISNSICIGHGNGLGGVVDRGYLQTNFDSTVLAFNGKSQYHIPNNWIPAQGQPGGQSMVDSQITTGSVRPRNIALLACIKY